MSYWNQPPMPGDDAVLFTVGDAAVTRTSVILPYGRFPLRGTYWTLRNHSFPTSNIPVWAIVLAVVLFTFTCGLSLLFLLAKETRISGFAEVTIDGPNGLHHVTRIAAIDPYTVSWVQDQVAQAQALAAS